MRMPEKLWQQYTNLAIKQSTKENRLISLSEIIIKSLEQHLKKDGK